jgi:hypothetical protein
LGSFEPGKEFSFLEVRPRKLREETDRPPPATARQAILEDLLETSEADLDEYRPSGVLGWIVDRLQATGLEIGGDLRWLVAEFGGTVRRTDDKITRVTLAGRTAWERNS